MALSETAFLDAATDLHNGIEVAQGESGHPRPPTAAISPGMAPTTDPDPPDPLR
ncbi:hypothetical protein [Streptomyces griseorubiginosus]|uniref:hypothetical protein n=1 Tax=Streptomyces griseorubiginosus TaxID=67304 RepID=UPI0036664BA1